MNEEMTALLRFAESMTNNFMAFCKENDMYNIAKAQLGTKEGFIKNVTDVKDDVYPIEEAVYSRIVQTMWYTLRTNAEMFCEKICNTPQNIINTYPAFSNRLASLRSYCASYVFIGLVNNSNSSRALKARFLQKEMEFLHSIYATEALIAEEMSDRFKKLDSVLKQKEYHDEENIKFDI